MKKFITTMAMTTALMGAAFAQQGSNSSLNVNPNLNVIPVTGISGNGVNPATLNNSAIGSGNLNGNSAAALNGNRALNGNGALNGSANGTSAANGLNGSLLNGTNASAAGTHVPVLNGTILQSRR